MSFKNLFNVVLLVLVATAIILQFSEDKTKEAVAQVDPQILQLLHSLPPECVWSREKDGQVALTCRPPAKRGWVIRGANDFECGVYVPGKPKRLNCNLSGGSQRHRGYVVLSPDNGKGTIMEDGHKNKLVLVRGDRYGGTVFRTRPRFRHGLIICDNKGEDCLDLYRTLRILHPKMP